MYLECRGGVAGRQEAETARGKLSCAHACTWAATGVAKRAGAGGHRRPANGTPLLAYRGEAAGPPQRGGWPARAGNGGRGEAGEAGEAR